MRICTLFCTLLFLIPLAGRVQGQCWETLFPYPTSNSIGGLFLRDSNEFYVSGNAGLLLRFQNAGVTKRQYYANTQSFLTTICAFDTQHIASGGFIPGGFVRTLDAGESWQNMSLQGSTGIRDMALRTSRSAVAVGQNGHLYRTEDKGLTWSHSVLPGASHLHAVQFLDSLHGFASGFFYTFFETRDGGLTWSVDTLETPYSGLGFFSDVFFLDSLTGFLPGNNGVLMRTSDGGNSWQAINLGITDNISYLRSMTLFANGKLVLIGDNARYYYSSDLGLIWQSRNLGDYNFQTIASKGAFGIIVCADGQLLRTRDSGDKWEDISRSLPSDFYDVRMQNGHTGILVGSGNHLYRIRNRGQVVEPLVSGVSDTNQVWFSVSRGIRDSLIFVGGGQGKILRSPNFGNTWNPAQVQAMAGAIRRIWRLSASRSLAIGTDGEILTSQDLGLNWAITSSFPGFVLRGLYFQDSLTGFISGDSSLGFNNYLGRIWKTDDGGDTWTLTGQGAGLLYDIDFTSPDTGMVVGGIILNDAYYARILKTTNGGQSWFSPSGNTLYPNFLYKIRMGGQKAIAIGHQGECYRTQNGGASWIRVFSSTSSRIFGMDFPHPDTAFAAGFKSTLLRYQCEPLIQSWDVVTAVQKPGMQNGEEAGEIFPQPNTGTFYFRVSGEGTGVSHWQIRDALGRSVPARMQYEWGLLQVDLSASPGMYWLQNGQIRKPILLTKSR